MSLKIVPGSSEKTASLKDTANDLGIHDTLRYGPRSLAAEANNESELKMRLDKWEETQDELQLNLQRNMFGMAAPLRTLMERKIVAFDPHMPFMTRSNIHLDILMGRDESLDVHDIFEGHNTGLPLDIHSDMEKKLRM